ncbi:unnamed protein product [Symbiodinium natans]|uniref:RING-type domain-containing protein n=1 Tax=Symbiodinium natans TaxID=878477 RepID=A0A812U1V4_9DINO|nr:unnamed protein product [Symbiodinium natans]
MDSVHRQHKVVDEAPLVKELASLREALLSRLDRNAGQLSCRWVQEAVNRTARRSTDPSAFLPLQGAIATVANSGQPSQSHGWWGDSSMKLALDELSTLILPWLQELIEDYRRGSRSTKIFCVKDVAGCRIRDACVHLGRNDWDVEAALQSLYASTEPSKKLEVKKPKAVASWSTRGAKLKKNEVDCPICAEAYTAGNSSVMTHCCFQVFCERCHKRVTDAEGRLNCPFCRGADGMPCLDLDSEEEPPAQSRLQRVAGLLQAPRRLAALTTRLCAGMGSCLPNAAAGSLRDGLRQLAPACMLCAAVVICNICPST